MSQSRGLLLLTIAILTLPIWTLIKNSLHAQGWDPQRSSHERFEPSKTWLFSTFAIPATLEDQQRLKKWATQLSLQKSEPLGFHYKNPLGHPFANFRCFLNLNLYPNWPFEFEFAFEFRTYILHILWSRSQTEDDLSLSVRTFFKKRTPFHLLLSPCKRASYHTYFVAIILSADENDQNKYPLCGKAITTSDSVWKNDPN